MKTLPQIFRRFGLILGVFALLAIGALAQDQGGKVKITNARIEIHPGVKLSEEDQKALSDVLKKFDKSLYRIEDYKNGKLAKTDGELKDIHINKTLASELASAKAHGVTVTTVQVVDTSRTWQAPPPAGPQVITATNLKDLIEQVKPIVEKYSKK